MKKLNTVRLKDENRVITIYYNNKEKSFTVHSQDYEDVSEALIEYSFESFLKTFRLMEFMAKELCLVDSDARKELFNINKLDKPKIEVDLV